MMEVHPVADLFPLMAEDDLRALAEDIAANGLIHPIMLAVDGRVLDGRNRLAACEIAGMEPRFETAPEGDDLALVVSLNVKRRNLTAGQRAVAAAEAWDLATAQSVPSDDGHGRRQALAAMFGVGENYVQQARALVERVPDAATAVKRGEADLAATYKKLRAAEAAVEGERERARREAEEAARQAAETQRVYEELLAQAPAEIDPEPLRPEEVAIAGANVELAAAADLPDSEAERLDERPVIEAQRALVLEMSALATRLANTEPLLPQDRFLDVSVLASRDAVRRLTQNATTWLRALNDTYVAHTKEGQK